MTVLWLTCLNEYKGTKKRKAAFRFLPFPPRSSRCFLMFSLPHINTELIGNEADDVGRQHLHVRLHAHRFQFVQERFAPTHQCLRGDTRTVSQLLFCHCLHIIKYLVSYSKYTYTLIHLNCKSLRVPHIRAVREVCQNRGVSGVCVSTSLASPLCRLSISAVLRRTTM